MEKILENFFAYWDDESYEDGASAMCEHQDTLKLEKHFQAPFYTKEELSAFDNTQRLLIFTGSFLMAKHIVEISYRYQEARALYAQASLAIRSMDADLFMSLSELSELQSAVLKIDRGIYTGDARFMSDAAIELKQKTDSIIEALEAAPENLTPSEQTCYTVIQKNLLSKVKEDQIYAGAIITVSELYLDRWSQTSELDKKITAVETAVKALEAAGNERLASDLAPHLHIIKRFEDRRADQGKLFIKNGEVAFHYYATLDYRVLDEFNLLLREALSSDGESSEKLKQLLNCSQLVSEEMSDIWSGLGSIEFIDTYILKLNDLKIRQFRELDELSASVELKYYTMGIFELKIGVAIDNDYLEKAPDGLSLTGLRHLQSIGTPFSLDEMIMAEDEEIKSRYQFLADYADDLFHILGQQIIPLLNTQDIALLPMEKVPDTDHEYKKVLTFNTEQNRFTTIRVNQVIEKFPTHTVRLTPKKMRDHFQYMALVMPIREVRSAIDNWIMYDASTMDENLAGIRYNDGEWLSINLHASVITLLEQPVWVFDQAVESVEVAGAIVNLLNLSNIQIMEQIDQLKRTKTNHIDDQEASELDTKKLRLESEIAQLDEFELHLSKLLETIEAGSMMTYPDHTIFMEKVFQTMQLERYQKKTGTLLKELKNRRAKSMELITQINEAFSKRRQKTIKFWVSVLSVFLTLGSMGSLFETWNNSGLVKEMGWVDTNGDGHLFTIALLSAIAISWLVYDNFGERIKKLFAKTADK